MSIHEHGIARETLRDVDFHFGMSGDVSRAGVPFPKGWLGPRAIDMQNRGGSVAEDLWIEYLSKPTQHSELLNQFLVAFDDIARRKPPKHLVFPAGAKANGANIAGTPKYMSLRDKAMSNMADAPRKNPRDYGTATQRGTRWSKVAIEMTIRRGGNIHFHLDGMGEIFEICTDKLNADYGYNVTARELRYVYRNWHRLKDKVFFYNGFANRVVQFMAVRVHAPWDQGQRMHSDGSKPDQVAGILI